MLSEFSMASAPATCLFNSQQNSNSWLISGRPRRSDWQCLRDCCSPPMRWSN